MSNSFAQSATKESLIKELNANYKSYLEYSLIYKLLFSIASAPPASKNHEDIVEAKIKETFWKSHIVVKNELTDDQQQLLHTEPLDTAEKKYITTHIEHVLEKQLVEIDHFMKGNNETLTKIDNMDQLLLSVRELCDTVRNAELNVNKLNDDVNIKLEHCVHLTSEIATLLRGILNDFKLQFYVRENVLNCETQLLKCESVLAKIDKVVAELKCELYSPDKLKSLKVVRSQLNTELSQCKNKNDQLSQMLSLYKSLGEDFEHVLSKYKDLKSQLDYKKWTLAKLNDDMHY